MDENGKRGFAHRIDTIVEFGRDETSLFWQFQSNKLQYLL